MLLTRRQRWNEPWRDLSLRNQMSHLLESLGSTWPSLAATFPALNVWQENDKIDVEAELPGMELNDLEIYVTGGDQLTISGDRKPPQIENATWHRQERAFGRFTRVLGLPVPVDADQVDARLVDGILTIALPKSAAAQPKKIPVKAD